MDYKLVICTKNESDTLSGVLEEILTEVPKNNIVIIDGHSDDDTVKIADSYGIDVILDNGSGKGAAIRKAISCLKEEILVFMDADGSHDKNDIERFITLIRDKDYELVIGSRILGGSDEANISFDHIIRSIGSQIVALTISLFFQKSISDVENGFRAINRKSFESLNLRSSGFTIEQEMVIIALKNNLNICEIASHEFARKGGRSTQPLFKV